MKKQVLFIVLLVISSCATQKKVTERIPVIKERIVEKLVPYVIPSDSAAIRARFYCDSLNQVRLRDFNELKSAGVASDFSFSNNELKYSAKVIHDTLYLIEKTIDREVPVYIEKPVVTNKLTNWQKKQIWAGRFLFALVFVWLLSKLNWKSIISSIIKLIIKK